MKETLVAYKATDIQQQGNKVTATVIVDIIQPNEEEEPFSPFLSLCSAIAGTKVKLRILDVILEPQYSYRVELEVAE